jgi:hypothetical protein
MQEIPTNSKFVYLFDEETRTIISSLLLNYRLAWYNKGRVVAVVPLSKPDTTYLVDLEDNEGRMSCTCDSFMFKPDPQLVGQQRSNSVSCRHTFLVGFALKRNLLR